jgi:membrane protease subunit (stomatin/prohibitin family)
MAMIRFEGMANPWLVYKWRETKTIIGSQLAVGPGQEVVFFKNGLPLDAFGPGTHSLTAGNLPLLQRISKPQSDDHPLFGVEIYFVNKIAWLDLMWSSDNLLQVFDPKLHAIVRVASHGRMGMRIDNTQLFLSQMCDALSEDAIENYNRVEIFSEDLVLENVKSGLANFITNQKTSLAGISAQNTALTAFIRQAVIRRFQRLGMDVLNFSVESLRVFEDDIGKLRGILHRKAEFETLGS